MKLSDLIRKLFPSYVSKKELLNLNDNLKKKISLLEKDVSVLNYRVEILNDTNKFLKKNYDSYRRKLFNQNIQKITVRTLVDNSYFMYPSFRLEEYLKTKLAEGLWEQLYGCIDWQCADDFSSDMKEYRATLEFVSYKEEVKEDE